MNIRADHGEMLSLIGPNGAGKTTALRVMAGLLEPTSGVLLFEDKILSGNQLLGLRRQATLVFQKPLIFSTTVSKNVAYGLRIRNVSGIETDRRVKEALDLVQLYPMRDRFARNLSGGEQKRLNLAMAIAIEPDILLLDEPTAFLDPDSRRIVENVLKDINREQGSTIVISTHDMMQADILTRKAVMIKDGKIIGSGSATEMIRDRLETLIFEDATLNVFSGVAQCMNGSAHGSRLVQVRINDVLSIEAITDREGDVTVRIPPEDIVLSRGSILSSARNTLRGKVTDVDIKNATALITVDVGVNLVTQITRGSLERLHVAIGDDVDVTFKASSVRVY